MAGPGDGKLSLHGCRRYRRDGAGRGVERNQRLFEVLSSRRIVERKKLGILQG